MTALRSLVAYHDVTWIASAITPEDRALAGRTIDETARDGSLYRLHLIAHDEQAYDWYYNVVANPALWFLQHSLWALANTPRVDRAFHVAWDQGYTVVNEDSRQRSSRSSSRPPMPPCSSTTTSSTWPRAWCARGSPTRS